MLSPVHAGPVAGRRVSKNRSPKVSQAFRESGVLVQRFVRTLRCSDKPSEQQRPDVERRSGSGSVPLASETGRPTGGTSYGVVLARRPADSPRVQVNLTLNRTTVSGLVPGAAAQQYSIEEFDPGSD